MIAATILIALALMAPDTKPSTTAQPATPAKPTAPGTGLVPKALLSGGDALAKSMQELVESGDVYSEEFPAMVEQSPSYAPRAVRRVFMSMRTIRLLG